MSARGRENSQADWAHTLAAVLTDENGVLDALSGLAQEKENGLISGDTQALNRILDEEVALMLRFEQLERRRQEILVRSGFPNARLRELAETAGGESGEQLYRLLDGLRDETARLKTRNDRNQALAGARLRQFASAVGTAGGSSYTADGEKHTPPVCAAATHTLMDQKG